MAVSWAYGVFLGMDSRDNTHRICDDGRVESARTITRLIDGRWSGRWRRSRLRASSAQTPSNPKDVQVRFGEEVQGEQRQPEPPSPPLYANYI